MNEASSSERPWRSRTPAQSELLACAPILDALPLRFPNNEQLDMVMIRCHACGRETPPARIHGRTTWLTPRAVRVEACAVCDLCETLLGIDARIYEDMSVVLLGSDGRWRRFEPPPRPSPIRRLVHRLRQALARLIR